MGSQECTNQVRCAADPLAQLLRCSVSEGTACMSKLPSVRFGRIRHLAVATVALRCARQLHAGSRSFLSCLTCVPASAGDERIFGVGVLFRKQASAASAAHASTACKACYCCSFSE